MVAENKTPEPNVRPRRQTASFARSVRTAINGFVHGTLVEKSIRRNTIAVVLLLPIVIALPVSRLEHLLLVLSMMLVVLVEFVNSAIEQTVDRISFEHHPLSGAAKDMASAAVLIAVLMSGLSWTVIVGPVLWRFFAR